MNGSGDPGRRGKAPISGIPLDQWMTAAALVDGVAEHGGLPEQAAVASAASGAIPLERPR